MLATHDSPPLAVVVQDLNKRSNNFAAEQVIRTLGAEIGGRPGTWDKGSRRWAAISRGVGGGRLVQMTNGAGLYDSNRFSAEQIVAVLAPHRATSASRPSSWPRWPWRAPTEPSRTAWPARWPSVRPRQDRHAGQRELPVRIRRLTGHKPLVFSILMNDVLNPPRRGAPKTARPRSSWPIWKATRTRNLDRCRGGSPVDRRVLGRPPRRGDP